MTDKTAGTQVYVYSCLHIAYRTTHFRNPHAMHVEQSCQPHRATAHHIRIQTSRSEPIDTKRTKRHLSTLGNTLPWQIMPKDHVCPSVCGMSLAGLACDLMSESFIVVITARCQHTRASIDCQQNATPTCAHNNVTYRWDNGDHEEIRRFFDAIAVV